MNMKIAIAGLGYVGTSLSVLLARNNSVIAYDIIESKIDMLNSKKTPINDALLQKCLSSTQLNLVATSDSKKAFEQAEIIIIATPTDYDVETEKFNTTSIEDVIDKILSVNNTASIVIKSTIPIGYVEYLIKKKQYPRIFFSPEFLRESQALYDNLHPSRIIVGTDKSSEDMMTRAKKIVDIFRDAALDKEIPCLIMGYSEATAVKLFSNTYLAMRVAFFNELDTYAEHHLLNTSEIINGVCLDPRIGKGYNNPSFGYGGYCLPKDSKQLRHEYENIPESLISSIVESNDTRKNYIENRIEQLVKERESYKELVIVGFYRLIMKTNSDNFRESASISIIERLKEKGLNIVIYEPTIENKETFCDCALINDLEQFKTTADIIIANRVDCELSSVITKTFTRDIYHMD